MEKQKGLLKKVFFCYISVQKLHKHKTVLRRIIHIGKDGGSWDIDIFQAGVPENESVCYSHIVCSHLIHQIIERGQDLYVFVSMLVIDDDIL